MGTLVPPSLFACVAGLPGHGGRRVWTKAGGRLPLSSEYGNWASGGVDGNTQLAYWGLDLWPPNTGCFEGFSDWVYKLLPSTYRKFFLVLN